MSKAVEIDFKKLLDLASSHSEIEPLEYNLFELYQLYRKNYQIRRLFRASWMKPEDKLATLKSLPCFVPSKVFEQLMGLIVANEMTDKIYYVYDGFGKVVDKELGRVIVQVFSSVQLSLAQTEEIKLALEKVLGKKISLKVFVDEGLVGGLIIKLSNGKIYDFTYKKLLSEFKHYMMERN